MYTDRSMCSFIINGSIFFFRAIDKVSSDECSPPTNSGERAIKATSQLSDNANASVKNQTSTKTAAQIAFEEVQKKRRQELAKRMASKSHREKVEVRTSYIVYRHANV